MSARSAGLPDCAAPRRATALARSRMGVCLPANACDAHAHVFGPARCYPLDEQRDYTPHVGTLDPYREPVLDVDAAHALARRVAAPGWHLQVHVKLAKSAIAPLQSLAAHVTMPIVTEHIGRVDPHAVPDGLLGLLRDGRWWVKLSAPYRLNIRQPDYADLRPLVEKLPDPELRRQICVTPNPANLYFS